MKNILTSPKNALTNQLNRDNIYDKDVMLLTKLQLILALTKMRTMAEGTSQVRIHIGNQLYDVDHIDTVIDMDTNKPNIVIHVKEN